MMDIRALYGIYMYTLWLDKKTAKVMIFLGFLAVSQEQIKKLESLKQLLVVQEHQQELESIYNAKNM